MSKFLYLFRGGDEPYAKLSPEEAQAHMQRWGDWMQQLSEKGKLIDGMPLAEHGKQVKERGNTIIDGPFTEGKEVVGGYLLVNSKDIDEAVELSKACPIFEIGGEIEVRETMDM
ncbi:MAG: YciI family protein [Bacteroidota bacterium]